MGRTLLAWNELRNPPITTSEVTNMQLQQFSTYFETIWIQGKLSPTLWSHFDNIGPRINNLAEGWHNSINYTFGMPHPSITNFLHWLQAANMKFNAELHN